LAAGLLQVMPPSKLERAILKAASRLWAKNRMSLMTVLRFQKSSCTAKKRVRGFFDPESFFRDQRIALMLGTAAKRLDLTRKTVSLANGEVIAFEKALIATGGRPVHLGGRLKINYSPSCTRDVNLNGRSAVFLGNVLLVPPFSLF
jgi:hypothetical protein